MPRTVSSKSFLKEERILRQQITRSGLPETAYRTLCAAPYQIRLSLTTTSARLLHSAAWGC